MFFLRKHKIKTVFLIAALATACFLSSAAVLAEEPNDEKPGCCEVTDQTETGKEFTAFLFVKSKGICEQTCVFGNESGNTQSCFFDQNTDKESCEAKDTEVGGISGCCKVEYKDKSKFAYALIKNGDECLKLCEGKDYLNCAFDVEMNFKTCEDEIKKTDVAAILVSDNTNFGPFDFPDASGLNQLSSTDVKIIIGNAIKTAMGLMGSVALAMFVYGGILWMSSAGNAERSKKGMQVIVWASLGVFVIMASYVVVNFVFETFK